MTHFACADEPDHPGNSAAVGCYLQQADPRLCKARLSIANSAGVVGLAAKSW
ncbi:MAG: hypothetical protein U5L01_17995 [Rheinheimera sp.]|nr:hypothetical protein [Rheinheimera sp.]